MPTDLVALVRQRVDAHQQMTERHDMRVETTEPEIVGEWDAVRLTRALDNLLSNAVKYSPDGGVITVIVARENGQTDTDGTGEEWALVRVSDQGLGIPASDLPHVFERFQRAHNAVTRFDGSGIGLTAARQVIVQHGGTIDVESQEGAGSAFTVRLPLRHHV